MTRFKKSKLYLHQQNAILLFHHQTKPYWMYQILQNNIPTEKSPQSRSSAGWLWGRWRGWYCKAPVPVGPLLLFEAPCLQYHTTPLSMMLDSSKLPQQPVAKICQLTTHITTALAYTDVTFQAETHFTFVCVCVWLYIYIYKQTLQYT